MEKFILSASRGLVEIVGSRNKAERPRAQFIHQTVKDFLQARLESSICHNVVGESHNILKTGCIEYVSLAVRVIQPLQASLCDMHPAISDRQKVILDMFPLLDYALEGMVTHAELAQSHGVPQSAFVKAYPLDLVIKLSMYLPWLRWIANPIFAFCDQDIYVCCIQCPQAPIHGILGSG